MLLKGRMIPWGWHGVTGVGGWVGGSPFQRRACPINIGIHSIFATVSYCRRMPSVDLEPKLRALCEHAQTTSNYYLQSFTTLCNILEQDV